MRKRWKMFFAVIAALVLVFGLVIGSVWAPDRPVETLKAKWAPPPSVFVSIAGMSVHLRDQGPRNDPLPVVLIHGTSASLHTWEGWAAELAKTRRVVSFDLPGFGLTGPAPDSDYSMPAYVRFVGELLDALHIERCVLAGNSLGGNIAWASALAYPQRVDRYYELALRAGNRQALGRRFEAMFKEDDSKRIAEIKQPTLIIWGGRDRLIPPAQAERFHKDIAGSQLVVFDDLGHVGQEEDPARTVAAVKRFLGMT